MAEYAIHPPIRLVTRPDEPIRSPRGGRQGIRRHASDHLDHKAEDVLTQIKRATTLEKADAAGKAFRAWAEAQGLLLVPRKTERPANEI